MQEIIRANPPPDRDQLKTRVKQEFEAVTPEQAQNSLNHCERFYAQCRARLPFTGKILDPLPCKYV